MPLSNISHIAMLKYELGVVGPLPIQRVPYSRFSRINYQFLWQRISYSTSPSVLFFTFRAKADISWLHRISQYRQIIDNQHFAKEKSLHCCTHSWGDKGLAVHYIDETNISDRLSRRCSPEQ